MSYFDIFKCCSVNNHLIFVRQYCLVFLFLSLLFHLYFRLSPRPIYLPIFQVQDSPKRHLQQQAVSPQQQQANPPKQAQSSRLGQRLSTHQPSSFLPCTIGTCTDGSPLRQGHDATCCLLSHLNMHAHRDLQQTSCIAPSTCLHVLVTCHPPATAFDG